MSYTNNLSTPELTRTSTQRQDTDTYFSNVYKPRFNASPDQAAALQTYFEGVTNDKESARLLTTSVIYTALSQNTLSTAENTLATVSTVIDKTKYSESFAKVYIENFPYNKKSTMPNVFEQFKSGNDGAYQNLLSKIQSSFDLALKLEI